MTEPSSNSTPTARTTRLGANLNDSSADKSAVCFYVSFATSTIARVPWCDDLRVKGGTIIDRPATMLRDGNAGCPLRLAPQNWRSDCSVELSRASEAATRAASEPSAKQHGQQHGLSPSEWSSMSCWSTKVPLASTCMPQRVQSSERLGVRTGP